MSLAGFEHRPIEAVPSRSAGWRNRTSEARCPPDRATCHPLVSRADAGSRRFPCHPAIAHPTSIWPGRMGTVWCVFTLLSHGVSQCTPRAWQAAGLGPSVPCWPLVPASPHLHSTMNSCCSTLNFHFSFTKIKNQAHNQAESSQNLRWEALLRTEARQTVFQRLIAFSECISIYFFPPALESLGIGEPKKRGSSYARG